MRYAFSGCTSLTTIEFPSLTQIGANSSSVDEAHFREAFSGCTSLTTIAFPELEAIYCTGTEGTFKFNESIQKIYLPKLKTITYGTGASSSNMLGCQGIFLNCTSLTEIHFSAENQASIEASPGYPILWGRLGEATVYFDSTP